MSESYEDPPDWDLPDPDGARRDPAELLDDVEAFLARFVAFPDENTRVAVTLWAAHCHALMAFESTPRIAFLSPEPGSGKTRALEVLELLVPRPVLSMNATPAYLFRKVSDPAGPPTILYDEIDTVFGPRAKEHEDLRGLLNAGHRRGATAGRCVVRGKVVETEELPAYAAVAMAGLDDLPDTLRSRSVIARMRRRAPHEVVEPFRHRVHADAGHALRDQVAQWASATAGKLTTSYPDMPEGVEDRDADVWEPLIAVAEAAGGRWPTRARVAAVALVAATRETEAQTIGVRLLADLRTVFGNEDKLSTEAVLTALVAMEESPWGAIGKPPKELDARGLARRLGRYRIKPKTVRIGDSTPKGYERADLLDAWVRYLPDPPCGGGPSNTSSQKSDTHRERDRGGEETLLADRPEASAEDESADLLSLLPQGAATSATPQQPPGCPHRDDGGECYACWEAGRAS